MAMTAADIKVIVGADVSDAVRNLQTVDNQLEKGKKTASGASIAAGIAGAGIFAGFGMAARSAMGYEAALNSMQASIGATKDQMEPLGSLALDIGAKTQFSATQGAQAIEELGKAGVSIPDILNGAALSAAQLASATGTDIPMAANVMANAMNTFGLSGSEATRVADVMTAALNASSLDMNDFANGMASVGSSAAALGIPLEDTAAALAIFSNRGMSGADAGTSLRSMFTHLASPTQEAADLMANLGIAAFDAQGNFVGLEGLAGQLQTQMAGLSDEQRLAALSTIFGADAQRVANILFEEGAGGVAKMTDELQANGQAQEASKIRMQGLAGALEQLKGSVETAFISFGMIFMPVLTKVALFAARGANALTKLSKPVKTIILGVGALVGAFGLLAGGMGPILALAGPLSPLLTGIGAAIAAMLAPFILITAAVIGLYLAFKNNFFGIKDIAMSVAGAIGSFVDTASRIVEVMKLAFASGYPVKDLLYLFPAPLRDIAEQFLLVADSIGDLIHAWQSGGFGAMMDMLPDKLRIIGRALGNLASMGLNALQNAFASIDWGALGEALASGLQTVADYAADWGGKILAAAGDIGGQIATWIFIQLKAVPWATILSQGLGALSDLAGFIIAKAGDLGADLKTWYDNAINSVNWGNLGETAGQAVRAAVLLIAPMAADLVTGFISYLTNNWQQIGKTLFGLIVAIPAIIGYIGFTMLPKVLEFLGGFVQGLGINWGIVGNWFKGLPGRIVAAVPGLASTLLQHGIDLLVGLMQGLIDYWPSIKGWLATLGPLAFEAVTDLAAYLIPRGIQLLVGLIQGLIDYWPTIKHWLGTIGTLAYDAIGGLAETLLTRGNQLLKGLRTGAENTWDTVTRWLGTLGTLALAAIPDLGGVLWDAGWSLMDGLYSGISSGWERVKGLLSGITSQIPDWKGPPDRDAKLLYGSGQLVMQGFERGLWAGWANVRGALQQMTPMVAGTVNANAAGNGAFTGGASGGQTIVYHDNRTFTVDVDSLEDVASAVGVINDLRRDAELVYGAI